MPCDTRLARNQTIQQRAEEVRATAAKLAAELAAGRVKPKIGAKGGIAFEGFSDEDRNRVTDACLYRRIMATGSSFAKAAIAKAEQLAGRSVDRKAIANGLHSHDGGKSWHHHVVAALALAGMLALAPPAEAHGCHASHDAGHSHDHRCR
jgi:alkylation response protein AidB-like acyl-CoA dehydrogenase